MICMLLKNELRYKMDYDNRSKEELIAELENLKQEMTILKELSKYPMPGPEFAVADSLSPESLYFSVLNALPDTITITNLQGVILYSSPQTIEMFGYTNPKDVLNKSLFDFLDRILFRIRFDFLDIVLFISLFLLLNKVQEKKNKWTSLKRKQALSV